MESSFSFIWDQVKLDLQKKFTSSVFDLWFKDLNLEYIEDNGLAILSSTNSKFINLIDSKYSTVLSDQFKISTDFNVKVKIVDKNDFNLDDYVSTYEENNKKPVDNKIIINELLNDKYTFDTFIVSGSNEFSCAACKAISNSAPSSIYNPLFIWGPSGCGKTHLLKAIENQSLINNPSYNVIYIRSEDFMNEMTQNISNGTMQKFKEKYRNVDFLLIDDIQFIAGKKSTQEEVFHTFNTLYENGKQIVLTSDRPPKDMAELEDRLRSRFESGLLTDIQPPDIELRISIAKSKAKQKNLELDNEIFYYIGENIRNNIRQIEGAINKLASLKLIDPNPIDLEKVKANLSSYIENQESPATIAEKIIECVSRNYDVSVDEIKGTKRDKEIAIARHISIYVIREVTDFSTPNIAKFFGGRDHSTILNSIKTIEKMIKDSPEFERKITQIIREFKN